MTIRASPQLSYLLNVFATVFQQRFHDRIALGRPAAADKVPLRLVQVASAFALLIASLAIPTASVTAQPGGAQEVCQAPLVAPYVSIANSFPNSRVWINGQELSRDQSYGSPLQQDLSGIPVRFEVRSAEGQVPLLTIESFVMPLAPATISVGVAALDDVPGVPYLRVFEDDQRRTSAGFSRLFLRNDSNAPLNFAFGGSTGTLASGTQQVFLAGIGDVDLGLSAEGAAPTSIGVFPSLPGVESLIYLKSATDAVTATRAVGAGTPAGPAGCPDADSVTCQGLLGTVLLAAGQVPTDGDDVIIGTDADDQIAAGAGSDAVCARGGDDTVWGQDGDDVILGGEGDDRLRGGDGRDALLGQAGADDLNGGRGNDRVEAGEGDDLKVRGGTGDDYVDGGPGNDLLVAGNGGADLVNGGDGNDVLVTGGPRVDTVWGGAGDDVVKGNKGADLLFGNDGDDQIFGGPQPDTIDGGAGTDACNGGTTGGEPVAVEADSAAQCEGDIVNVP